MQSQKSFNQATVMYTNHKCILNCNSNFCEPTCDEQNTKSQNVMCNNPFLSTKESSQTRPTLYKLKG